MARRKKAINYLSNKELLKEIHKSKISYSEFEDLLYSDYDIITDNLLNVNEELVNQAKINKANRLNELTGDKMFLEGSTNKQIDSFLDEHGVKAINLKKEDIVIRLMTNEHIPVIKDRKGKMIKNPVNFPAFQHYIWRDKKWVCVGKSHWHNGKFSTIHGNTSRKLGMAYMKLVEKYGNRGNWRSYSWLSEMRGVALLRLSQVGLGFNEFKSDNPFSYLTTIISHSFTSVLNKEKELLSMKNKIIQEMGHDASFSEQADHDYANYMRDNAPHLVKDE